MLRRYPLLISFSFLVIFVLSCEKEDRPQNQFWELPYFGFNAKGTLNTAEQTTFADTYFKQIAADIKQNLVVRVSGGTASQLTFDADWSAEIISKWVRLQKTHGLRLIFVVNGNDTPQNQKKIIQKWIDAGAHFDFIEMMNEYYLPKYALGDLSNPEVTEQISPEKYVDTILPRFWQQLDVFGLPYYLILAPTHPGNVQTYYAQWNEKVLNAINNKYAARSLNATVHLYLRGSGDAFDYTQITGLKARLPSSSHLAITEAGVLDDNITSAQAGEGAVAHYKQIVTRLTKGDYLLDQTLYNDYPISNTADLSPVFKGITPKGSAILSYINNRFK